MIKSITNINSNGRLTSEYKNPNNNAFQNTLVGQATCIEPQGTIKISFEYIGLFGYNKYSSATLVAKFSSIPLHTIFTLKDEDGEIVDIIKMDEVSPSDATLSIDYVSFDITSHIIKHLFYGEIGSLYLTSNCSTNLGFVSFETIDAANVNASTKAAYFQILYSDLRGKHDFIEYESLQLGSSGKLDVSLPLGNAFFKSQLMLSNLAVSTLDISLMYSSILKGWKHSFDYGVSVNSTDNIITLTTPEFNEDTYYLLDADKKKTLVGSTDDTIYYNYEDSSYISISDDTNYVLHKDDGTKINFTIFYSKMEISSIILKNGDTFEFDYYKTNSGLTHNLSIKGIEDTNDLISFKYATDSSRNRQLVTVVSTNKSIETEILYDYGNLKAINTYKNELVPFQENNIDKVLIKSTLFDYDADNRLIRISNLIDNKKLELIYNSQAKVTSISEFLMDQEKVSTVINVTELKYNISYTSVKKDDEVTYHYFDLYGSTIYILDSKGHAINLNYTKTSDFDDEENAHRLSNLSLVSIKSNNLIQNGSFDLTNYLDGWTIDDDTNIVTSQVDDSANGSKALSIINQGNTPIVLSQSFDVDKSGRYLFSFLSNVQQSLNDDYEVSLEIEYTEKLYRSPNDQNYDVLNPSTHYDEDDRTITKSFVIDQSSGWKKLEEEIIVPSNSSITLSIEIPGGGSLLLNDINFKNDDNLIKNNSFEEHTNNSIASFGIDIHSNFDFINVDDIANSNNHINNLEGVALHIPQATSINRDTIAQFIPYKGRDNQIFTFSMWLKSYISNNEDIDIEIQFLDANDNVLSNHHIYPTKHISIWQIVSGSFISEYPFEGIEVIISKFGYHEAYFDELSLVPTIDSTYFSYDQKGNVTSLSEDSTQDAYYDNDRRLVSKSNRNNECLSYRYNDDGKLINVFDNFKNTLTFDYDGDTTTKTVSNGTKQIVTSITSSNGLTTKTDEFENVTQEGRDEFGNVVGNVNAKHVCVSKTFNHQFRIKQIERTYLADILATANFKYDMYGNPRSINLSDDTNYRFKYDDYGRLVSSKLNEIEIASFEYKDKQDKPYKTIINSSTLEMMYVDDKLKGYVIDGVEQYSFVVDDFNRIISYQNEIDSSKTYLTYADNNKLSSKYTDNGDGYYLEFDNLCNIQKEIISSGNDVVSADFIRDYEFNNHSIHSFAQRLIDDLNDDVVVGIEGPSTRLGERHLMNNLRYVYDAELGYSTFQIYKEEYGVYYDLSQVNDQKCSLKTLHHPFNRALFQSSFVDTKNIYGWFKVTKVSSLPTPCKVFIFCDENRSSIGEVTVLNNNLTLKIGSRTEFIHLDDSLDDTWVMLYVSLRQNENGSSIKLYVNGELGCTITTNTQFVSSFTRLALSRYEPPTLQMQEQLAANTLSVALLAFGGGLTSDNDVLALYEEGQLSLFGDNVQKHSGATYSLLNNNVEYFSLNGSFIGSNKTQPVDIAVFDQTNKIKKNQYFEYDSTLKRHIYCSFDETIRPLQKDKSLLSYDFNIQNTFHLSLGFELLETSQSNDRVIASFNDENDNSVLRIYLDIANKLYANNTLIANRVANYQWRTLNISVSNNTANISINNGAPVSISNITLSRTITYIGCEPSATRESINQLNGYIKDIYVSESSISSNITSMSVNKNIDSFGRISSLNIGPITKTLYYEQPKDENGDPITNRTSLRISRETNSLNDDISYEYDANGNVAKRIINNNEIEYEYDGFDRLTKSTTSLLETSYSYDSNGNVLSVSLTDSNEVTTSKAFEYDSNKRLVKITDNNVETNITYSTNTLYPTQIGNMSLSWTGDLLTSVTKNNNTYSYSYDFNGKLVKKVGQSQTVTTYLYQDNKLIQESYSGGKTIYLYDETDLPIGFIVFSNQTSNCFYYIKDELGIINKIIDSFGTVVAQYTYDDFGKLISATGQNVVIQANHIIYKGYLYDFDLEMYLLGKRFYYPYIYRFISPDNINNLFESIAEYVQFNLFAYCDNNPLIRIDSNGEKWLLVFVVGVIVTIVAACALVVVATIATTEAIGKSDSLLSATQEFAKTIFDTLYLVAVASKTAYLWIESLYLNCDISFTNYFNITFSSTLKDYLINNYQGLVGISSIVGNLMFIVANYSISNSVKSNYTTNLEILNNCIFNYLADRTYYNDLFDIVNGFDYDKDWFEYQNGENQRAIKFGASNIEDAGCGIIAVYNALLFLGRAELAGKFIANLISLFEYKSTLFGKIGVQPGQIIDFLNDNCIPHRIFYSKSELLEYLSSLDCPLNNIGLISTIINKDSFANIQDNLTMHTTFIGFYTVEHTDTFKYYSFNDYHSSGDDISDYWDREFGVNRFMSCIVIKKE